MSIPSKDLKLLWGKAAGRCAITKRALTSEASAAVPSRNILLGENCHIVAEKEEGPRGKSILTEEERNRYPNLILLCAEEHIRIDQDPTAWPVEKLHQIKVDHELWVQEQLAQATNHEDEVYAFLINLITDRLQLDRWNVRSDDMLRGLVLVDWIEGADQVVAEIFRVNWPHKYPELENAIQNLNRRLEAYTHSYMAHAAPSLSHTFYGHDKWYREIRDDNERHNTSLVFNHWQGLCTAYLMNLTAALNEYAAAVRKDFKPDYFFVSGKFSIEDGMGYTNQLQACTYVPETYQDLRGAEATYERWSKYLVEGRSEEVSIEWEATHQPPKNP